MRNYCKYPAQPLCYITALRYVCVLCFRLIARVGVREQVWKCACMCACVRVHVCACVCLRGYAGVGWRMIVAVLNASYWFCNQGLCIVLAGAFVFTIQQEY